MPGLELRQHLDAGDLRHPLVGHHDVHFLLLHHPVALLGAVRLEDPEFAPEQVLHRIAYIRLIIHDQHAVPGGWHIEANSATPFPFGVVSRRRAIPADRPDGGRLVAPDLGERPPPHPRTSPTISRDDRGFDHLPLGVGVRFASGRELLYSDSRPRRRVVAGSGRAGGVRSGRPRRRGAEIRESSDRACPRSPTTSSSAGMSASPATSGVVATPRSAGAARRVQAGAEEGRVRDAGPGQSRGLPGAMRAWPDGGDLSAGDLVRPGQGRGRSPDREPDDPGRARSSTTC